MYKAYLYVNAVLVWSLWTDSVMRLEFNENSNCTPSHNVECLFAHIGKRRTYRRWTGKLLDGEFLSPSNTLASTAPAALYCVHGGSDQSRAVELRKSQARSMHRHHGAHRRHLVRDFKDCRALSVRAC